MMARNYLKKAFLALDPSKNLKDTIQAVLLSSFDEVCASVKQKALIQVKNSQRLLKSPIKTTSKSPKAEIQLRRKDYLENFETKLLESKNMALKFIKDQKDRSTRQQMREVIVRQKQLRESQERDKLEEHQKSLQRVLKNQQIQSIRKKSEMRKMEIDSIGALIRSKHRATVSATPRFKKLEEEFKLKFEIPELERRKRELQLKRELAKPISLAEIKEHSRKINSLLEEIQERKQTSKIIDDKAYVASHKSKFIENLLEEERRIKLEQRKKEFDKKTRVENKKQYGKIVNELYQPSIDKFKQQEMKLIKARLEFPVKLRSSALISKRESATECSRSVSVQPRTWKKNSMIPEPPEPRVEKKIFYLEQQRKKKEGSPVINKEMLNWHERLEELGSESERLEYLKNHATRLEKAVKKYEGRLKDGNLDIDVAEHIDELIINSIKAKLIYLDS